MPEKIVKVVQYLVPPKNILVQHRIAVLSDGTTIRVTNTPTLPAGGKEFRLVPDPATGGFYSRLKEI
jgi:hypothetical protein